jgi:hypothetical protein
MYAYCHFKVTNYIYYHFNYFQLTGFTLLLLSMVTLCNGLLYEFANLVMYITCSVHSTGIGGSNVNETTYNNLALVCSR